MSAHDVTDGTERWRFPLGGQNRDPWGLTVVDDDLYVAGAAFTDDDRQGFVTAVDRGGPRRRWTTDTADWASPVATDGDLACCVVNFEGVRAFDAADGTERWRHDATVEGVVAPPALSDGLYVPTTYGVTKLTRDGRVAWRRGRSGGAGPSSPLTTDGLVVVAYANGETRTESLVVAFDDATGRTVWSRTESERAFQEPVAVGDTVYVGGRSGRLYAYDLATGDRRWTVESDATHVTAPVPAASRLVFASRTGGTVYAVSADGTALPTPAVTVSPESSLVGQTVTVDAGGSSDPDGRVAGYEWTVLADGYSAEAPETVATGTGERLSFTPQTPGEVRVRLRVTDDDGLSAATTESLLVDTAPLSVDTRTVTPPDSKTVTRVAGTPFTARFRVENDGDRPLAATLSLDRPEDVPVTGHTDAGATWTGDGWQFDALPADEPVTVAVTLTPPADAEPGEHPLSATLTSDFGETVGTASYRLAVVREAVPVREALVGTDGSVSNAELTHALDCWLRDQPVGGTGGERVSDRLLLRLIRAFRADQGGGS